MADVAIWSALLLAAFAGASMPLGAALALSPPARHLDDRVLKGIVAFGGGALISAVALVLVPDGAERLPPLAALMALVAGGLTFFLVDARLERGGGRGAQLLAMLLDYLPEAMALGAVLTGDAGTATLLALMIFLQNLPEGFSAFRDMRQSGRIDGAHIVMLFVGLALLGPLFAGLGFAVLPAHPEILGAIMLFASGGILYLVFQDIAPGAHQSHAWSPSLGAVFGFALGLAGHLFLT